MKREKRMRLTTTPVKEWVPIVLGPGTILWVTPAIVKLGVGSVHWKSATPCVLLHALQEILLLLRKTCATVAFINVGLDALLGLLQSFCLFKCNLWELTRFLLDDDKAPELVAPAQKLILLCLPGIIRTFAVRLAFRFLGLVAGLRTRWGLGGLSGLGPRWGL